MRRCVARRRLIAWCAVVCSLALSPPHPGFAQPVGAHDPDAPDLTSLNIRLSRQAIHPPRRLVRSVVTLPPDVRAARAKVAPSPKAAVLEDDRRHRALIVSVLDNGRLRVEALADVDVAAVVPLVAACVVERGCAHDRRPVTGGLGCVALCIRRAIDSLPRP